MQKFCLKTKYYKSYVCIVFCLLYNNIKGIKTDIMEIDNKNISNYGAPDCERIQSTSYRLVFASGRCVFPKELNIGEKIVVVWIPGFWIKQDFKKFMTAR